MEPEIALLCLDGYAGRSKTKVLVIKECPKRILIEAITRTQLAGRSRWLDPGQRAYVPKRAIKWMEQLLRS
jgi:hypothetical protein